MIPKKVSNQYKQFRSRYSQLQMLNAEILCGIINQEVYKIFIKPEKTNDWPWTSENVSWKSCFEGSFVMTRPWKLLWMTAVLHPPVSWWKSSQQLHWSWEIVRSANQPKQSLNLIKFYNVEHQFEILHESRCDHPYITSAIRTGGKASFPPFLNRNIWEKKGQNMFSVGVWFSNLRIFWSSIPKANTRHPESQSQSKALLGSSYKMSWELLLFNTD